MDWMTLDMAICQMNHCPPRNVSIAIFKSIDQHKSWQKVAHKIKKKKTCKKTLSLTKHKNNHNFRMGSFCESKRRLKWWIGFGHFNGQFLLLSLRKRFREEKKNKSITKPKCHNISNDLITIFKAIKNVQLRDYRCWFIQIIRTTKSSFEKKEIKRIIFNIALILYKVLLKYIVTFDLMQQNNANIFGIWLIDFNVNWGTRIHFEN